MLKKKKKKYPSETERPEFDIQLSILFFRPSNGFQNWTSETYCGKLVMFLVIIWLLWVKVFCSQKI